MLAVAPHLVHTDRLAAGTTRFAELDAFGALARRRGGPRLTAPYDRLSGNGVLADPRRADPEHGEAIVAAIVDRITDFVTAWLRA